MKINNMMKLITMILILELIMSVATPTPRINVDERVSYSPECFWHCVNTCFGDPNCMIQCLAGCVKTPAERNGVRMCTATCAQATCSKFVDSSE